MGASHYVTNTGGISSVTMSYFVKDVQLSFGVSIESAQESEW